RRIPESFRSRPGCCALVDGKVTGCWFPCSSACHNSYSTVEAKRGGKKVKFCKYSHFGQERNRQLVVLGDSSGPPPTPDRRREEVPASEAVDGRIRWDGSPGIGKIVILVSARRFRVTQPAPRPPVPRRSAVVEGLGRNREATPCSLHPRSMIWICP